MRFVPIFILGDPLAHSLAMRFWLALPMSG
jgi:hypothetical protein